MRRNSALVILAGGALLATPLAVGGALLATPVDVGGALPATSVGVASNAPPNEPITQPALNRQIDRVLENPEFNWRESYSPAQGSSQKSLIDQLISWTRRDASFLRRRIEPALEIAAKGFRFQKFLCRTVDVRLATACRNI